MSTKQLLAAVGVLSLMVVPAMAQTTDKETNGHHYNGGPKTEVPHHMGSKKETVGSSKRSTSGGHHYTGGPATANPHHMDDKAK